FTPVRDPSRIIGRRYDLSMPSSLPILFSSTSQNPYWHDRDLALHIDRPFDEDANNVLSQAGIIFVSELCGHHTSLTVEWYLLDLKTFEFLSPDLTGESHSKSQRRVDRPMKPPPSLYLNITSTRERQ
ncbi:hypothetical protein FRC16_001476, partial [Serendipita sp. 398]